MSPTRNTRDSKADAGDASSRREHAVSAKAAASATDELAALLERIAAGSETALREFYDSFHSRVYAFALRRLNDTTDAAEVLNEVMLEVWRQAGRFEGRSRAQTWVLGIAHHKVIDTLRRRRAPPGEAIDPDLLGADTPSAVEALAGAEDAARVRHCLEQLSDAHRLVVHLAFFEDLSYTEIAEIAKCPQGTVKTRMFHAKKLLLRCLGRTS